MLSRTFPSESDSASSVGAASMSTFSHVWGKCKAFRRKNNSPSPKGAVVDVRPTAMKVARNRSFRISNKTRSKEGTFLFDDTDDKSVNLSVCSAPEMAATKLKICTISRSGSFEIPEERKGFRMPEETKTFDPSILSTHKKSIQAVCSAAVEDALASQSVADTTKTAALSATERSINDFFAIQQQQPTDEQPKKHSPNIGHQLLERLGWRRPTAMKVARNRSFRFFNKTTSKEGSFLFDDTDDKSVNLSVCSAPEMAATKHRICTLSRSGFFEIREERKGFRMPKETKTFDPSILSTHKKLIQAVCSAAVEDVLASQSVAEESRRGLETSIWSHTDSSTDSSLHSEEVETSSVIAEKFLEDIKLFDRNDGRVSFGMPHVITVPSWKGEDLWWTKQELRLSHVSQSAQLVNSDQAKLYLQRYEEAQEEMYLSQIYNLDGKPHLEKLPGGVKKGLREGFAGLEVFSLFESRRRLRSRAIVRSVVELSLRTGNSVEVGRHAQRLNAPSLEWAVVLAKAHQRYDRLLDI